MRGIVERSGCADDNNDNEHGPRNGHNNNPADDHKFGREYCYLHPGLGLLHVPNDVGCLLQGWYAVEDNARKYSLPPLPCGQVYVKTS